MYKTNKVFTDQFFETPVEENNMNEDNQEFNLDQELNNLAFVSGNETAYVEFVIRRESDMFGRNRAFQDNEGNVAVDIQVSEIGDRNVSLTRSDLDRIRENASIAELAVKRDMHRLQEEHMAFTMKLYKDWHGA